MNRAMSDVVAHNLRTVRSSARLSQADLAERMRYLGHETWSHTTVSEVERCRRRVGVTEMAALSMVFGVTITRLIGDSPHLPPDRVTPALPSRR